MKRPEDEAPELAETLMETAERLQQCAQVGQIGKGGHVLFTWKAIDFICSKIIVLAEMLVPHIMEIEEPAYGLFGAVVDMEKPLNEAEYREER